MMFAVRFSAIELYALIIVCAQDFSKSSRRHWSISSDGLASLSINRVAKNDEGLWECWEIDSQGSAKQKATALNLVVAKSKITFTFNVYFCYSSDTQLAIYAIAFAFMRIEFYTWNCIELTGRTVKFRHRTSGCLCPSVFSHGMQTRSHMSFILNAKPYALSCVLLIIFLVVTVVYSVSLPEKRRIVLQQLIYLALSFVYLSSN